MAGNNSEVAAKPSVADDISESDAAHERDETSTQNLAASPWDELEELGVDLTGFTKGQKGKQPAAESRKKPGGASKNNRESEEEEESESEEDDDDDEDEESDNDKTRREEEEDEADSDDKAHDDDESEESKKSTEEDEAEEGQGHLGGLKKVLEKHGVPKGVVKRFMSVMKRNAEQKGQIGQKDEQIQQLTQQVEELEARPPVKAQALEGQPLSDVFDIKELEAKVEAAQYWLDWCLDNPEGGTFKDGGEVNADKVKEIKASARVILNHAGKREKQLEKIAKAEREAKSQYPTLFQKGHADQKERDRILNEVPEFRRLENANEIVALYLKGKAIRDEEATGKVKYQRISLLDKNTGTSGADKATEGKGKGKGKNTDLPTANSGRTVVAPSDDKGKSSVSKLWGAARGSTGVDAEALMDAFA